MPCTPFWEPSNPECRHSSLWVDSLSSRAGAILNRFACYPIRILQVWTPASDLCLTYLRSVKTMANEPFVLKVCLLLDWQAFSFLQAGHSYWLNFSFMVIGMDQCTTEP